ncbi:DUF1302 domain-containing protein [Pandoraea sp. NPDC087047]|uniref:DUF1302 domain-containing protein n=1 Tax=Pandoraea sp. NPDC087047 TaxID=3364390 RepID=UPI0038226EF0
MERTGTSCKTGNTGAQWVRGLAACSFATASASTGAGTVTMGEDVRVDYLLTTNYSLGVRVGRPSQALMNDANADDSERSFKRGSLVNNRMSVTGQADIKWRNYGIFVGGSAFYDDVYNRGNDNDSQATLNRSGNSNSFSSATRDYDGRRARLLDAFAYGSWDLGDGRKLSVNAGHHVVAWGESLFFPGISGGQGRADATKSNIAGVETKDVLLPTGQISGQYPVTRDISLLAYYQYRFRPTELQPTGDYLFMTDVLGPGAQKMFLAPGFAIDRTPDAMPKPSGQWGIGTRFRLSPAFEMGAYHINYSTKTPMVEFDTRGAMPTYRVRYFENVRATALSFTTRLGNASVAGEMAYHDGLPVQIDTPGFPAIVRGKAIQAQLNVFDAFGPNAISDRSLVLGEVVGQYLLGVDGNPFDAGARNSDLVSATRSALGYQISYIPSWNNVFPGWDLSVPISWNHTLYGIGVVSQTGMLHGGDMRASLGATFTYLGNLEIALKYNAFLGKPALDGYGRQRRPLADRDFITLNVKYSF